MNVSIVVALITGGFAFLGSLVASTLAQSKTLYRIDQLEEKVDKHNSMIERTYILEGKVEALEKGCK